MKPICYQLDAREVVQGAGIRRGAGAQLFIGLLMRPPGPEGVGSVEVSGSGFIRQEVSMVAQTPSSQLLVNKDRVVFEGVEFGAQATHAALYDAAGAVVGYGVLASSPGVATAGSASFGCRMIRLRLN